jgi:glycerol-3-phosphate acyltransferase PlsX
MLGGILTASAFDAVKKQIDYAEHGGAPLLGVNGICIISHGRSSAKAIKNAIRVAGEFVDHKVNHHILESVKKS